MLIANSSLLDCKYFCSGDVTEFVRLPGNKMKTIRCGWFSVSERQFVLNYCSVCFSDGFRPQLCSAQWGYIKKKKEKRVMSTPSLWGKKDCEGALVWVGKGDAEPQIWYGARINAGNKNAAVAWGFGKAALVLVEGFHWGSWVLEGRGRLSREK